jgi:HSP20 family protein
MPNVAVQKVSDPAKMPLSMSDSMQTIFDQIKEKAFCLFCENGSTHGHAIEDWLKAERELFQVPESELVENDKEFTLQVTAPGFEAKDLEITALPDSIVVKSEATQESEKTEGKVYFSEFSNKQLYRRYALPSAIDVNKTVAILEKGMLKVIAQKADQQTKSEKTISIAAA